MSIFDSCKLDSSFDEMYDKECNIRPHWDFNHSQGEVTEFEPKISGEANSIFAVEANRKVSSKVGSKKLYFHEMPRNKEYPHTLDLRQRWMKS